MLIVLFAAALLIGFANGANDNFKGVATLWGSGSMTYRPTLLLATLCTFAGSICSFYFAAELIKNFSGKGLVPDAIVQSPVFVLATALAAGATVLLATRLGFPVSTTHSIIGALTGAGLVAAGSAVNFSKLGKTFFAPLLLSPAAAVAAGFCAYAVFTRLRTAAGITRLSTVQQHTDEAAPVHYNGAIAGIPFQQVVNKLHFASAGLLSFSRGLNDTPKMVSLLLLSNFFSLPVNTLLMALMIAAGGLLNGKRIATTLSRKITPMNHGQGFTANLVTSILMITATRMGLPAAITHISVGSIYGVSLLNKTADNRQILRIALSWVLTLPAAAVLSAFFYFIIHQFNQ